MVRWTSPCQRSAAVVHDALNNASRQMRSRVGGATYQFEGPSERASAVLAIGRATRKPRWRAPFGRIHAANNRGNAVKKREDTHRMADANRAFSHYRW
jgi:small subunit ribosomal protein S7